MSLFIEELEYLAAVTKALNALPPAPENMHLQVDLYAYGEKVGDWSDEIAGDAWNYTPEAT